LPKLLETLGHDLIASLKIGDLGSIVVAWLKYQAATRLIQFPVLAGWEAFGYIVVDIA
jgi:hypothetical protein